MARDPKQERKIRRLAKQLGEAVAAYGTHLGRRLEIFGEDGSAYVLDVERDSEIMRAQEVGPSGCHECSRHRGKPVEDGGSIVIGLPRGGVSWSGGGF